MRKLATSAAMIGALAMAAPAMAADPAWVVDTSGGTSASVANKSGNMTLIVGCVAPNVALALSGSGVEVDPAAEVAIKVGAKSFPLTFGKARSSVLLNNRTDGAAGITDDLFAALRTGKSAVLTGAAFAAAPADSLSFSLSGSGDALKTVKDSCGAAPVPAPAN